MINMLEEKWCESFSKPLAVFNKAFIRRLGKGLHPYIKITGSENDCKYCVDMEAQLFYDNGLYESNEVYQIQSDSVARGVYFVGEWLNHDVLLYKKLSEDGSLLFFTGGDVQRANHYNITGCEAYSFKGQFLKMIDMPCDDGIFDIVSEKYSDIFRCDIETAVNNTMLCHYSMYDDDVIHIDDFKWVKEGMDVKIDIPAPEPKVTEEANDTLEADSPENKPATKTGDQETVDSKKPEESLYTEQKPESELELPVEKSTSDVPKEELKRKPLNKKTAKKKKNSYGLTEEDEKRNREYLIKVRKEYTELLNYVVSLNASMWKPIERIVRNSLETDDYSESIILKYLELSKDITTELYNHLYDITEPIRREFIDGVKRKMKPLVCYNCSSKWKVDVTFMEKDHDEAECPICGSAVGFDKD